MKDHMNELYWFSELLRGLYPGASLTQIDIAARLLVGGWYLTLDELMETSVRLSWEDKEK
jgi:hypothetical protein